MELKSILDNSVACATYFASCKVNKQLRDFRAVRRGEVDVVVPAKVLSRLLGVVQVPECIETLLGLRQSLRAVNILNEMRTRLTRSPNNPVGHLFVIGEVGAEYNEPGCDDLNHVIDEKKLGQCTREVLAALRYCGATIEWPQRDHPSEVGFLVKVKQ